MLRDPVLDAVVNENATRRPTHGVPTDSRADAATASAQSNRGVGVRGITGSLTAFEVDEAMATRGGALMACVQQRPNRLGHVAGDIKFHMDIDPRGKADRVRITQSNIGHPVLERCLTDVVASAPFPAPAGNERAEATWQMSVDPLGRGAEPIDPAEVEEAITQHSAASYEACAIDRDRRFVVTGYVSSQGKLGPVSVLSVWRGARTYEDTPVELDCLAASLAEWNHWPRVQRHSKATFELRWVAEPEPPRARGRGRAQAHKRAGRNKRH